MNNSHSLMWSPKITVAKVEHAKKVLSLPDICSAEEIRMAYLRLVKKFHPDKHMKCDYAEDLNSKIAEITGAWNFMKYVMQNYKYSFTEEVFHLYQEPAEIMHARQFDITLWPGEINTVGNKFLDDFLTDKIRVTYENAAFALELLKLPEIMTKATLMYSYTTFLSKHKSFTEPELIKKNNAYLFLMKIIKHYRYILTSEEIRKNQEDSLEWHRKHFDNEPLWSGGIFDNPFYKTPPEGGNNDYKFRGIC